MGLEGGVPIREGISKIMRNPVGVDGGVRGFNGKLVTNAFEELNEALRGRDRSRIERARELVAAARREFPEFRKRIDDLGFWERMIISVGGDVPASNFATHTVVRDLGFRYIASTLFQTGLFDTNRGGGLWIGTDVAGGHWSNAPGGGNRKGASSCIHYQKSTKERRR
jgi:hypothetical protein